MLPPSAWDEGFGGDCTISNRRPLPRSATVLLGGTGARIGRAGRGSLGQVGVDGLVDVAVQLVDAHPIENSLSFQGVLDRRFHAGESQDEAGFVSECDDLGYLRRALRVDEVDPLAVEHQTGEGRVGSA